jgi:hypothetical protein
MAQGAIDPRTDVDAAQLNRLTNDLAALVRVAPFAKLLVQCHDTSPDDPVVLWCYLQNGVQTGSYNGDAPPTGFPTVTRVSNGSFRVTFAANPIDDFGVAATLDIKAAKGTARALHADVGWSVDDPDADGYNERATFTVNDGSAVSDPVVLVEIF